MSDYIIKDKNYIFELHNQVTWLGNRIKTLTEAKQSSDAEAKLIYEENEELQSKLLKYRLFSAASCMGLLVTLWYCVL